MFNFRITKRVRSLITVCAVSAAAALTLGCKFGDSKTTESNGESPMIAWGLKGVFDAPRVEAIATTALTGARSGANYGFVEFIRTPYGIIANVNLMYLDPGSYFVSITDRNVCSSGNYDFPDASMESEVGVIKVGEERFARVSKILTEFDRNSFEVYDLFGKCVEVRMVSSGSTTEGDTLLALGEIGSKDRGELVF